MNFEFFSPRQVQKIYNSLVYYFAPNATMIVLLVCAAVWCIVLCLSRMLRSRWAKADAVWKRTASFGMSLYVFFLLQMCLFNRKAAEYRSVMWIPFQWIEPNGRVHESRFIEGFLNMAIFVPFGILLFPYGKGRLRVQIGVAFVLSASIQLAQYYTRRGSFSVEDILLAVLGSVLGLLLRRRKARNPQKWEKSSTDSG